MVHAMGIELHAGHRVESSDYVLVIHPHVGSLWLSNPRIEGDYVIGEVEADTMFGHPIMETLNFPVTCIRKIQHGRP